MLIVKFRGLIDKIIQVLSTIIMGVMVIAVCWQVITRYILNNPSTVTEEALVGRANALQKMGKRDEERAAWLLLLSKYPNSIHAGRAKARVAELAAKK